MSRRDRPGCGIIRDCCLLIHSSLVMTAKRTSSSVTCNGTETRTQPCGGYIRIYRFLMSLRTTCTSIPSAWIFRLYVVIFVLSLTIKRINATCQTCVLVEIRYQSFFLPTSIASSLTPCCTSPTRPSSRKSNICSPENSCSSSCSANLNAARCGPRSDTRCRVKVW